MLRRRLSVAVLCAALCGCNLDKTCQTPYPEPRSLSEWGSQAPTDCAHACSYQPPYCSTYAYDAGLNPGYTMVFEDGGNAPRNWGYTFADGSAVPPDFFPLIQEVDCSQELPSYLIEPDGTAWEESFDASAPGYGYVISRIGITLPFGGACTDLCTTVNPSWPQGEPTGDPAPTSCSFQSTPDVECTFPDSYYCTSTGPWAPLP